MRDKTTPAARLRVTVKPGSRKGPLVEQDEAGHLTLYVRERAVDGAANDAVVALLAAHFGVKPRHVRIVSGHTARFKTIEIADAGA